jgi:magnesium chelatase family protein
VLAKVCSCAVVGLEGVPVEVEVDISQGLPSFQIVGLPDAAVQESKERVRAAVKNSGNSFPMKRLTVNLAPADIRKAGPAYDLPIAVGLLLASEQVSGQVERALFVGELGLDGALRHTDGVLPMVSVAKSHGIDTVYVPFEDAPEAGLVEGATVIPVKSLAELAAHLSGERPLPAYLAGPVAADAEVLYPVDFQDVKGQEQI